MPIFTYRSANVNNEHCNEFGKAYVSITFPCNSKNAIIFFPFEVQIQLFESVL